MRKSRLIIRKLELLMIAVLIIVLMPSCNYKKNYNNVAVITKSTESQFWKSLYEGVNAASNEYNLKFTFNGASNEEDYFYQNALLEQAINDKVDVIIFSAINYNASVELIERASDSGIYVIIIDSDVNSQKVDMRIGTDNYKAGIKAAEQANGLSEKKLNVGIVNFVASSANGQQREQGFRDKLGENSRAKLVQTINVNSNIDSAREGTKELLKNNPDLNVIATFNEWTTLGVGEAIRELNLKDEVYVTAFDNNIATVNMLETGEVDSLIVQNPFAIGYLSMENAYKLINNIGIKTKNIYTETKVITKENMFDRSNQEILFDFE